jgi:hypothetical protein
MLKMPEVRRRPWFPQRRWDGHAIPGKRLFIPGVGLGYGDLCWLCRLLPLVKTRSQATVGLGVPAGMTEVLTSLQGMDYVVEEPLETDPFDVHMHLATLPGIPGCEFTPEHISKAPYLTAEPTLMDRWRPMFSNRSINIGMQP